MKFRLLIAFVSFSSFIARAQQPLNLMPMPKQMNVKQGEFVLTDKFAITVDANAKDTILYKAVNRFYQALNRKTALYFATQRFLPSKPVKEGSMKISVA